MRIRSDRNFIEVEGPREFQLWAIREFALALQAVADERAASLEDRAQRTRFHALMESRRVLRLAKKRLPLRVRSGGSPV